MAFHNFPRPVTATEPLEFTSSSRAKAPPRPKTAFPVQTTWREGMVPHLHSRAEPRLSHGGSLMGHFGSWSVPQDDIAAFRDERSALSLRRHTAQTLPGTCA